MISRSPILSRLQQRSRSARALVLPALLLAAAVLTAACSGQSASAGAVSTNTTGAAAAPASSGASSGGAGPTYTVNLTDANQFQPATLTVPKGATVTWKNTSQTTHTVTDDPSKASNKADAALPSGAQVWDSGNLAAGQSFSHTFDVPGTYKYFCVPHESLGMVATITVTG
jgi:plastocyanin